MARQMFSIFEGASELGCNMSKCQLAPIRCDADQLQLATNLFPCQVVQFPVKYLGLPLSVSKLPKSALQPLVDKVAYYLSSWKGRLLHRSGRLAQNKSTLTAVPIYTSISLGLPKWMHKVLIKIMRAFLWSGSDETQAGKCLVAWSGVQRPT
jgi:hypothetical protein